MDKHKLSFYRRELVNLKVLKTWRNSAFLFSILGLSLVGVIIGICFAIKHYFSKKRLFETLRKEGITVKELV